MIETAQPSAIQKRLASEKEDKKHRNVHGVALAANGAPKNSLLYKLNDRAKERRERQLGETSRQIMAKHDARSFVSKTN